MSSQELTEWRAYEQVTGTLGQERDDLLAAIIAERVTAMLSDPTKRKKRFTVEDFKPRWGRPKAKERQSPEQQKNILKALTRAFGGN